MGKSRLEAFSDGVLAIALTIMVLDLRPPAGAHFDDLRAVFPVWLGYILSFVYVAIYWNNHHHMFHAIARVNGAILWANMHLLFWLSLVPFVTAWLGQTHFAPAPTALYGVILLMAALAWYILQTALVAQHGPHSALAKALGNDWKGKLSLVIYIVGIAASFRFVWLADACYVGVALLWLIPDRRFARAAQEQASHLPAPATTPKS